MAKHSSTFAKLALMMACCLAMFAGAFAEGGKRELLTSGGYDKLLGKWQGTCVQVYADGYCTKDIISYPYYVEYKYDKYYNKYYTQTRRDAVHITTDSHYSSPREYHVDAYSTKGYVTFYNAGSFSWCVSAYYENNYKRTYRIKYKYEGDLHFLVEEGEYDYQYYGVWGKCFNKSYKSLFCKDNYSYSYRCYLVKTSYDYKW